MSRFNLFMLIPVMLAATAAGAAPPELVNYQGILTDRFGVPVSGQHDLTFTIYRDSLSTTPVVWTETQTGVPVANGLFQVMLGSRTPLPATAFTSSSRWLAIRVDSEAEMAPRARFTSVPWSLRCGIADSVAAGGTGDGDWIVTGADMHAGVSGNVGIGIATPGRKLQIGDNTVSNSEGMIRLASRSGTQGSNRIWDVGVPETDGVSSGIGYSFIINDTQNSTEAEMLVKWGTGHVGIGTTSPDAPLHVLKPIDSTAGCALEVQTLYDLGGLTRTVTTTLDGGSWNTTSSLGTTVPLRLNNTSDGNVLIVGGGGRVGIGTSSPAAKLDVAGTARVSVLEIAGADLAEKFPLTETATPGSVVVIDPAAPGALRLSREPYDRRVAGVVSGANGLSVGAVLGQCTTEPGAEAVAMSGRVWTWCDASETGIEPGDLLTSSARPGHAMKAADASRSHGAVIGKAMTGLAEGRTGLVLVLVNLH